MTEIEDPITVEPPLTVEEANTIIAALEVAGDAVTRERAERIAGKLHEAIDRWAVS